MTRAPRLGDRKCCGILCEAVSDYALDRLKYVVIGVGVNVNTAVWPADIAQRAGSIRADRLSDKEFTEFAVKLTEELLRCVYEPKKDDIEYYRRHSNVIGKEITFTENGAEYSGFAVDIDENGALIVNVDQAEQRTLDSGEISLRC